MSSIALEATNVYREIHEQPEVLSRLLELERPKIQALVAEMKRRDIAHVVIAARGTSDNAGRYAQYLLGAANRLCVGLTTPSLFSVYGTPPRFGNALVLGISQSGKSPDIVSVLAEARRQGALTAAITNATDSDLARVCEHVIDIAAGIERSVAATKTYTAELCAIALLSVLLSGDPGRDAALRRVPEWVSQALSMHSGVGTIAERYRYMAACVTIGRGYNYATAFELGLKLKEMTYTVVEAYSSADFLHGPLAMLTPGFPVIVIAPSGAMLPDLLTFMRSVRERGAELLVISDAPQAFEPARIRLPLPVGAPEWLSPLIAIIPGQLFALHLAHLRDLDPDHPRALHKITETR